MNGHDVYSVLVQPSIMSHECPCMSGAGAGAGAGSGSGSGAEAGEERGGVLGREVLGRGGVAARLPWPGLFGRAGVVERVRAGEVVRRNAPIRRRKSSATAASELDVDTAVRRCGEPAPGGLEPPPPWPSPAGCGAVPVPPRLANKESRLATDLRCGVAGRSEGPVGAVCPPRRESARRREGRR